MSPGQLGLQVGVERWVCSRGTGGVGDLKEKDRGEGIPGEGHSPGKGRAGTSKKSPLEHEQEAVWGGEKGGGLRKNGLWL